VLKSFLDDDEAEQVHRKCGNPEHWWRCMALAQHTSCGPACHWLWSLVDAVQVLKVNVTYLYPTAGRLYFLVDKEVT